MKKDKPIQEHEVALTPHEFMESYNKNMPQGYPHVSLKMLEEFRDSHPSLFKGGSAWTLDQHRKPLIQWLPQNI